MDVTTLKEILIAYIPSISVLLGFLASCVGIIKQLKKSDLTKIKEEIKDDNSDLRKELKTLSLQFEAVMHENQELKKLNNKLLFELTRISDYKEE